MADFVLDTHTCVYSLLSPGKLGKSARKELERIESGKGTAWIPAAVVAEIVILRELRRIKIGLPEIKTAVEQAPCLRFLPLDMRQLEEFAVHVTVRDPFDRLILGATRALGAKLITKDSRLRESGVVQTIWD
jgi:PIN domain nuclease of toxin-antitoxin system